MRIHTKDIFQVIDNTSRIRIKHLIEKSKIGKLFNFFIKDKQVLVFHELDSDREVIFHYEKKNFFNYIIFSLILTNKEIHLKYSDDWVTVKKYKKVQAKLSNIYNFSEPDGKLCATLKNNIINTFNQRISELELSDFLNDILYIWFCRIEISFEDLQFSDFKEIVSETLLKNKFEKDYSLNSENPYPYYTEFIRKDFILKIDILARIDYFSSIAVITFLANPWESSNLESDYTKFLNFADSIKEEVIKNCEVEVSTIKASNLDILYKNINRVYNEKDVELYIVNPLLTFFDSFNYSQAQYKIKVGSKKFRVDRYIKKPGNEYIIEVKFNLNNTSEISEAYSQAQSYALIMGLRKFAIIDQSLIRIYRKIDKNTIDFALEKEIPIAKISKEPNKSFLSSWL